MFLFCFRLLTEYHSFLFYNTCEVCEPAEGAMVSVSLRSIIHSYFYELLHYLQLLDFEFPSPYGVSFILIDIAEVSHKSEDMWSVSVSLRSIIHSYSPPDSIIFLIDSIVSVSLRSIIHSYQSKFF